MEFFASTTHNAADAGRPGWLNIDTLRAYLRLRGQWIGGDSVGRNIVSDYLLIGGRVRVTRNSEGVRVDADEGGARLLRAAGVING